MGAARRHLDLALDERQPLADGISAARRQLDRAGSFLSLVPPEQR
jgi:hypothetical protein